MHCPEDFMFDPMEESPKASVSSVAYYKFLASEPGKNEDFNYHKYQLLKSHVKFYFIFYFFH